MSCFIKIYFSLTISYMYIIYSCYSCPTLSYIPPTPTCFPSHLSPNILCKVLFHFHWHNQYCPHGHMYEALNGIMNNSPVAILSKTMTSCPLSTLYHQYLTKLEPSPVRPFSVYDRMFTGSVWCRLFAGNSCWC